MAHDEKSGLSIWPDLIENIRARTPARFWPTARERHIAQTRSYNCARTMPRRAMLSALNLS